MSVSFHPVFKFISTALLAVVTQYYEAEVVSEYVIRGNTAVLKCNIPSFVADFVKVEAWVDSDGGQYLQTDDIGISFQLLYSMSYILYLTLPYILSVVNQFYEAEILTEYVIRGNAAVLKCSIPSFVADFVKVEAWIDEEGAVITHTENLGINVLLNKLYLLPVHKTIPYTSNRSNLI